MAGDTVRTQEAPAKHDASPGQLRTEVGSFSAWRRSAIWDPNRPLDELKPVSKLKKPAPQASR
jgi:hypothetical protein